MREVLGISRGHSRVPGAGDGGDLAIGVQDGPAQRSPGGGNGRIGSGGGAVEGQHTPREVLPDHSVDRIRKANATLPLRQDGRACVQLRFADARKIKPGGVLLRESSHDGR